MTKIRRCTPFLLCLATACSTQEVNFPTPVLLAPNARVVAGLEQGWLLGSDDRNRLWTFNVETKKWVKNISELLALPKDTELRLDCAERKSVTLSSWKTSKSAGMVMTSRVDTYRIKDLGRPDHLEKTENRFGCAPVDRYPDLLDDTYIRVTNDAGGFSADPKQWHIKASTYSSENELISEEALPAGPWVYEHSFLKELSCFSCGCSCYETLALRKHGGRWYAAIGGKAVKNKHRGIYVLRDGKWVHVINQSSDVWFFHPGDPCVVFFNAASKIHESNIFEGRLGC